LESDLANIEREVKKAADNETFENKGMKLPVYVLKLFQLIEDTINDVTPDQKKKMKTNTSKSYNKVKQRFKKYLAETGDDVKYEAQLKDFRENPPKEPEAPAKSKGSKDKKKIEEAKEEDEEYGEEYEDEEPEKEEEEDDESDDDEDDSESDEEIRKENKKKRKAEKAAAKAKAAAAAKA